MTYTEATRVAEHNGQAWEQRVQPLYPGRRHFVVCCSDGDCTGFLTLGGCMLYRPRRACHYWIEERH